MTEKIERSERREQIGQHLGVNPLNYGLVHIEELQIDAATISEGRLQTVKKSLVNQRLNLVPLLAYRLPDEAYKVVSGGETVLAAREIGLTHLLVFLFDSASLAEAAYLEMTSLVATTTSEPAPETAPESAPQSTAKKRAAKKPAAKKPAAKKNPTLAEIRARVRKGWGTEGTEEIKKRARALGLIPKGASMRLKATWTAILNGLDCWELPAAA